jgi:hypothetical protein
MYIEKISAFSELLLINNNRTDIGGFTSSIKYWSSTEYDYSKAIWPVISDNSANNDLKTSSSFLRAVRSF